MAGLGNHIGTHFVLRAQMNGNLYANGQWLMIWYYDRGAGSQGFMDDRFVPSAHIEAIEGQLTSVEFQNDSPMQHTIHFHGLDVDQANDGVPATSFAVYPFGSFTYQFVAPHAGTYHYHCHVDTTIHYEKGMYGTVIVRPPSGSTSEAWTGGPTFDEEVLWQLGTMDTSWNNENAPGPATARFYPDVFLLNGKETADARVDPFTRVAVTAGQKAYIRVLNSSYNWARVSLGGLPFQVVASDGRPLQSALASGVLELGPGERYDLLVQPLRPGTWSAHIDYTDGLTGAVVGGVQTDIVAV